MKALMAEFSLGREVWDRFRSRFNRGGGRNRSGGVSLNLMETSEPRIIASDWVKIRTIMSGISDLDESMILHHEPSPFSSYSSFPFVPGNENLGIVTETGEDVPGIEPGERVVVDPLLSCLRRGSEPFCPSCSRGEPSACRNFTIGVPGPGVLIGACKETSGGWADYFIAHRSQVWPVPQSMESLQAILVPEFSRALRAVLQHPPAADDYLVIVGDGSLALLTLLALRLLGYGTEAVLVAEHPFVAETARNFGASEVVVGHGPQTTYEEVAALVGGTVHYPEAGRMTIQGGADLVYETTGSTSGMEDAISFTGEGKKLVLMGMGRPSLLDAIHLRIKGITPASTMFSGREHYDGHITSTFDVAMDLVSRHGIPFEDLATHQFRLEDHSRAFAALADREASKALKIVFHHVV